MTITDDAGAVDVTESERQGFDFRGLSLLWWALADLATASRLSWATTAFGLFTIFTLPGATLVALLGLRPGSRGVRWTLAVGFSLVFFMTVGLALSALGRLIGIARPFDVAPATVTFAVATLVLVLIGFIRSADGATFLYDGLRWRAVGVAAVLALLPCAEVLATSHLNNTGSGGWVIAVIAVSVVLLLVTVILARWYAMPIPSVLFFVSVTLFFTATLRGQGLFGVDIQEEFGVANFASVHGSFVPVSGGDTYGSMLSLTALPALVHSLFNVSVMDVFRVVFPPLEAMTPVAIFAVCARRVPTWIAGVVVTWMILGSASFIPQMPMTGRQGLAMVLLAGIIVALTDRTLPLRGRQIIVVILGVGMSFTHYTTAYFFTLIFLGAWIIVSIGRLIKITHGKDRVLTIPVVAIVGLATVLWNFVINKSTEGLLSNFRTIKAEGALILPHQRGNFITNYLRGNTVTTYTPSEYQKAFLAYVHDNYKTLVVGPGADRVQLQSVHSYVMTGLLPGFRSLVNFLITVQSQAIIVIMLLSFIYVVWKAWRGYSVLTLEYCATLILSIALAIVFRFSASTSSLFSPQRVELVLAILFALPVAMLAHAFANDTSWRKWLVQVTLVGAALISTTAYAGLDGPLFGGVPSATISSRGIYVGQFVVSNTELTTANWYGSIQGELPFCQISADHYAGLIFLTLPYNDRCHKGQGTSLAPAGVNRYSYVYFSRDNVVNHRTQTELPPSGQVVFRTPAAYYNATRSVIFSTEQTRVYR